MWKFWIDTGGTFTDCLAVSPSGELMRAKALSNSCYRGTVAEVFEGRQIAVRLGRAFEDGFFEGYELRVFTRSEPRSFTIVDWKAESGLVVANAEIEGVEAGDLCEFQSPEEPPAFLARMVTGRKLNEALPPLEMRLATTRGTNALLELKGAKVAFVVTEGFGDILRIGNQQRPNLFELGIQKPEPLASIVYEVEGRLDKNGRCIREIDEAKFRKWIRYAIDECKVESFAIALLHSYKNGDQERQVERLLRESGAKFVSVSSKIAPFVKLLHRSETSVVDAYLSPLMDVYLDSVQRSLGEGKLRVMSSSGGLVGRGRFQAKDSLLSGPAGGVVGSSERGRAAGFDKTIAFDMGGTSTDVSRYDGVFDYRYEQRIGAARVYAPGLRIETVAAGGGSVCWFDGAALRVGPHSASASPGPASYGAGGPLTLTDVNLLLGRLDHTRFGIPIDLAAARFRLSELKLEIEKTTGTDLEEESLLRGYLDIANERMAETIREISIGEGYDPSEYALVAFGGAGGLHACSVAERLGIRSIVIPADAGLLSAYGLKVSRVEQEEGRQVLEILDTCLDDIAGWEAALLEKASSALLSEGVAAGEVEAKPTRFEMRYLGQESSLFIEGAVQGDGLRVAFERAYEAQFGFLPEGLPIELVSLRCGVASRIFETSEETFECECSESASGSADFYIDRSELKSGQHLVGPRVIQDSFSTVYLESGWSAAVGSQGTLLLDAGETETSPLLERSEVVALELFTNRFLSLVDNMGALLERLAFSTNVKERRDFSCGLLDREGRLVANAPHIPVHLGALGVCVRTVCDAVSMEPGDVVVTNHPAFGGSHLPDVTLIAPVYTEDGDSLIGYVANRAHHAEIGGISPGSMPPNAKNLAEEGVVIPPTKLVEKGRVRWERIEQLLAYADYPTRSLAENRADLEAQLASLRVGRSILQSLVAREGESVVFRYMDALRHKAASALRTALQEREGKRWIGEGKLDNGAPVSVRIDYSDNGILKIDFSGSGPCQNSNYNATPAIVSSAVVYVLRLLAGTDVPLNEGLLDSVSIEIPEGMLNPRFDEDPRKCPAVVAGNVEISQLVVSVLIRAFGLAADSQTTMNNFIFGTERFGYYETIGGGEGATPERDGASGLHTHMTNTASTDPEIMELRYPVRVERFSLRAKSGGKGKRCGGDGLVKRIRFLEPVSLSLLTQRRKERPQGLAGGETGAIGCQFLTSPSGAKVKLTGNGSWNIESGTSLEIRTPGGGGWGDAVD